MRLKKWLEASSEQHHYLALHTLGLMYYEGEFGKKDYDLAFQFLKESADLGYGPSQYYVGLMYKNGLGVEKGSRRGCCLSCACRKSRRYERTV